MRGSNYRYTSTRSTSAVRSLPSHTTPTPPSDYLTVGPKGRPRCPSTTLDTSNTLTSVRPSRPTALWVLSETHTHESTEAPAVSGPPGVGTPPSSTTGGRPGPGRRSESCLTRRTLPTGRRAPGGPRPQPPTTGPTGSTRVGESSSPGRRTRTPEIERPPDWWVGGYRSYFGRRRVCGE